MQSRSGRNDDLFLVCLLGSGLVFVGGGVNGGARSFFSL